MKIVRGQKRKGIGGSNAQRSLVAVFIVGLFKRVHPCGNGQTLVGAAFVERFHGSQFHGLHLCHLISRAVTRDGSEQRSHQSHAGTNFNALGGQLLFALLQQIPAADGNGKHRSDNPRRGYRVAELVDGKGRECHIQKRYHLVAHGVGVELATHGILHPSIGYQNPPSRNGGPQTGEPGGGEVEAARHLVPSKIHHGHKGRFHEECHYALYGKWRTEDVAHKPRVVAPVGAKLKFKNNAGGNAHGKVHTKEFLPEAGSGFPKLSARAVVAGFGYAHNNGKPQGEWNKKPVIDGGEGKLSSRPVYCSGGNV